ncbi:MAG: type II 3-dehydroquinate dehydratase [Pseudomonadota bacterium]|nr:MAG: type II 3-dehydroquinate dehydratase [Pseudomonadota bacterium]
MTAVLVIHGPNLNLLGRREPDIYGHDSLETINARMARFAASCDIDLDTFQSNAEHELIERIQQASETGVDWLIVNPAGLTHTSVVLRDALAAVGLPFVEVHMSNPYRREPFRHQSCLRDIAEGVICGFGADSYLLALQAVINRTDHSG